MTRLVVAALVTTVVALGYACDRVVDLTPASDLDGGIDTGSILDSPRAPDGLTPDAPDDGNLLLDAPDGDGSAPDDGPLSDDGPL